MDSNELDIKDEDIQDISFSPEELEDDATDWKAKALELEGIAKRRTTQLKKLKIAKEAAAKLGKLEQKEGLDYNHLAYLKASGIDNDDDVAFITNEVKTTGKELKEILGFKYVQEQLATFKNTREMQDAIPPGSPRSSSTIRDNVDYWIAKGQLPPADQVELRRKVVNERVKQEDSVSKFTDHPVIK